MAPKSSEKNFPELAPIGEAVYYTTNAGEVRPVKLEKTVSADMLENFHRAVDMELSSDVSNANTPRIASSIFALRSRELGSEESADAEHHRVEGLVNGSEKFQAVSNRLYKEMVDSAAKHGHPDVIPGLTDKAGQVVDQHDFAVALAYVSLQQLRRSQATDAVSANEAFTAEGPIAAERFDDLLVDAVAEEKGRNKELVEMPSTPANDKSIPKKYVFTRDEKDQNLFSIMCSVTAKAYSGSGNVLRWNAGVSASVILRDEQISAKFAAEKAQVPDDDFVVEEVVAPVGSDPDKGKKDGDKPPEEPTVPHKNEKLNDTKSGSILRKGLKLAAAIAAYKAVKAVPGATETLIKKQQGADSEHTAEKILRKAGVAGATITAASAAILAWRYASRQIDAADYKDLRNKTLATVGGLAVIYVGNRVARAYAKNHDMSADAMKATAARYTEKFFRKAEKKADKTEAADVRSGATASKAVGRLRQTMRDVATQLEGVEGISNKVEKQVQRVVNYVELVEKLIKDIPFAKPVTVKIIEVKDFVKSKGNKIEHLSSRIEAPASFVKNVLETIDQALDETTFGGVMRVVGRNAKQYFWETPEEQAARKAAAAKMKTESEAVATTGTGVEAGSADELIADAWRDSMVALDPTLTRDALKDLTDKEVIALGLVKLQELANMPVETEEATPVEPELRAATIDDVTGLAGLAEVVINIRAKTGTMADLDALLATNGLRMSPAVFDLLAQGQLQTELAGLKWDDTENKAVPK